MRHRKSGVATLGFMVISASLWANIFTLEVKSFKNEADANDFVSELVGHGLADVFVSYDPHAVASHFYRVRAGHYDTRKQALIANQVLETHGYHGNIRVADFDHDTALAAVKNELPRYFGTKNPLPVVQHDKDEQLDEPYQSMKDAALAGPTTAPETLAAIRCYIDLMPDTDKLKGREVLLLADRAFSGSSAYVPDPPDHIGILQLLIKVARREVVTGPNTRRAARAKAVHIMHYYNYDFINAIRGYHGIIREAEARNQYLELATARASLAGAILEMNKSYDFSSTVTLTSLYDLWTSNSLLQEDYRTSTSAAAQGVRTATCRIGLMVSECYLGTQQWESAQELTDQFIEIYKTYPECAGFVAEAYCHKAGIATALEEYAQAYEAATMAEQFAIQHNRPVWGDASRDVLWKAYTWKFDAAHKMKDKKLIREVSQAMLELFHDHPDISRYRLELVD